MSFSCCSESVELDSPTCTTGTLDAEYRMTSGGVVPGGSMRSWVWLIATTCASAVWMLACGWKNNLTTATPAIDCDSMCSMSLTVVVKARSVTPVMRLPISVAGKPL